MGKVLLIPLVVIFVLLTFLYTQGRLDQISSIIARKGQETFRQAVEKDGCDEECRQAIAEEVGRAVATISAKPKTPSIVQATPKHKPIYIPLDATGTTTSTNWVDVPAAEVSFDFAQDYGKDAKASWEASLKVAHGNGTAYARIFDVTHGIAVSGSEISTTSNADYKRASSGNLSLWAGRNIFRVQIKSLNSFEVGYTAGKIRISY